MELIEQPRVIYGQVVATNVSEEEYLEKYAANYCEWINGVVIKVSPGNLPHNYLMVYVFDLLRMFFKLKPIGKVAIMPFSMRLGEGERREPDILAVLNTNRHEFTETRLDGPADICIEIVSPESIERDRGEKFNQYQKAGVNECWILDPLRDETLFYRLNAEGVYIPQARDADGNYRTPLLPGFVLHIATLWQDELPDPLETGQAVKAMLANES
jgi:Uma2 family endonuclease